MRKWFGAAVTLVQAAFVMAILAPAVVTGIWLGKWDARKAARKRARGL